MGSQKISCELVHKSAGDVARAGATYHVPLHAELADLLERYAAEQHMKPEIIIAEAVRSYLGVDA